jgi:hypothetical protein
VGRFFENERDASAPREKGQSRVLSHFGSFSLD